MSEFEQVVVKLNERWYQGEEGDILVIARGQAGLIDCEILNTWENWKRAILTKKEEK